MCFVQGFLLCHIVSSSCFRVFGFRVVLSKWCVGGLHDSMHGLCWGVLVPTFNCCVHAEFAVKSVLSCVACCWMAVPLLLVVVVCHCRVEAHHKTQHGVTRCGVSGQAVCRTPQRRPRWCASVHLVRWWFVAFVLCVVTAHSRCFTSWSFLMCVCFLC